MAYTKIHNKITLILLTEAFTVQYTCTLTFR